MEFSDESWMQEALQLAKKAIVLGEVPVATIVVYEQQIVASAYNLKENLTSSIAHAEILAIHKASRKLGRWRLSGCTLYTTLEPCVMCAGALVASRLDRLVYGAKDPKGGAVDSIYKILADDRLNHQMIVTGAVLEKECSEILKKFFKKRRLFRKQN
jgi:tRNA(adenine34) deaminase